MNDIKLRRLKIEHSNAITAKLDEMVKSNERMMNHYALAFMESQDESDKTGYSLHKAKVAVMKQAIETTQNTSRDFEFSEDT